MGNVQTQALPGVNARARERHRTPILAAVVPPLPGAFLKPPALAVVADMIGRSPYLGRIFAFLNGGRQIVGKSALGGRFSRENRLSGVFDSDAIRGPANHDPMIRPQGKAAGTRRAP